MPIETQRSNETRILQSIAAKQAHRPKVDNQGRIIDAVLQTYDEYGRLISVTKADAEPAPPESTE